MERRYFFLVIIGFLFILSCSNGNTSERFRPEVTFYAGSSGIPGSVDLNMIIDLKNSGKLCDKPARIVELKTPSKGINPRIGFSGGDLIIFDIDKNNSIIYGRYFFEDIKADQVVRIVPFFERKGVGEKSIGSVSGNIFLFQEKNKAIKIGEIVYENITTPQGEKRTVCMHRLLGSNEKWIVLIKDKIYLKDKDRLTQVGWVDWRKIIIAEGKTLVILMTKGMDMNDKWGGRYDGVLYYDK